MNFNTILVVEDESSLQDAIVVKLKRNGFEVSIARSVDEAIENIKNLASIDLIWLDHYLLGDESGIDLMVQLRSNSVWENIPVIVVTNTGAEEKRNAYLKHGAIEYFIKSENRLEEIIEKIKRAT